jgi:hypothetical protein
MEAWGEQLIEAGPVITIPGINNLALKGRGMLFS